MLNNKYFIKMVNSSWRVPLFQSHVPKSDQNNCPSTFNIKKKSSRTTTFEILSPLIKNEIVYVFLFRYGFAFLPLAYSWEASFTFSPDGLTIFSPTLQGN